MKTFYKTFLLAIIFSLCSTFIFCIPGIKEFIPTASGEYVYYHDYTFKDETYIGFLYYDEFTLGLKYYSPKAQQGSKDIEIAVSLNPLKDAPELTGEKVLSNVSNDDVFILNYLHELLYQFAAYRKNINDVDLSKPLVLQENFSQFGGDVTMTYDFYIPVFNLRSITSSDGKKLFELASIGKLSSSQDSSFSLYTGTLKSNSDPKPSNYELKKQGFRKRISAFNSSVLLDNQWEKIADNVWLLGDCASLVLGSIEIDSSFTEKGEDPSPYLARSYLTSIFGDIDCIPRFESISVNMSDKKTLVENICYTPSIDKDLKNIRYFIKGKNNTYSVIILTVLSDAYKTNQKYFDNILKSAKYSK